MGRRLQRAGLVPGSTRNFSPPDGPVRRAWQHAAMSQEIELKFRIPAERLPALQRALATSSARRLALAARYYDTPDQRLAGARMALRLRREGEQWVQTLKAQGATALHRLEHNQVLRGRRSPVLDAGRHRGTPAGEALQRLLEQAGQPPLVERYATEVQRTLRVVRHQGARIELALDLGRLRAGGLQQPIAELELELLQGSPQALLDLAGRWARRFDLLLDSRSKSERGHHLALAAAAIAGGSREPVAVLAASPPAQPVPGQRRTLAQAVQTLLAHASQIADGPWTAAHLQALRRDLRGLQARLPEGEPLAALQRLRSRLAAARGAGAAPSVGEMLREPGAQTLWLGLIGLSLG